MHRHETQASPDQVKTPELPGAVDPSEIQTIRDGAGPLFHRRYAIRIRDARMSPEELIERIGADPNVVAPTEFARFIKVAGEDARMSVGDEFTVRMPGPWDGPVRVVEAGPCSFRFATLEGHLEAGQIEFRAHADDCDVLFEIESWARSGDRLSSLLFDRLPLAKEVQLHMWTSVLERAVRLAGGHRKGRTRIETERIQLDD